MPIEPVLTTFFCTSIRLFLWIDALRVAKDDDLLGNAYVDTQLVRTYSVMRCVVSLLNPSINSEQALAGQRLALWK